MNRKPPIFDETVALNCSVIADILSLILKCNPEISIVPLPSFRVLQLIRQSKVIGGRTGIIEADVLEALGSFYALCAIYGGSPEFECDETLLKASALIQRILDECIMSMKLIGEVSITHTDDVVRNLKYVGERTKEHLRTVFVKSNENVKDIIRDIVRQVRICREKGNARTKSKHPIDCLLPHSMYLMCTYSLSHIAAILHSRNRLCDAPGLYESLLCVLHFHFHRDPQRVKSAEKARRQKKTVIDSDRFDECIRLSKHLSYLVLKRIDIRFVQNVRHSTNLS